MKKKDFIRILNFVMDLHNTIDRDSLFEGTINREQYNNLSTGRNNFAIDLEFYLDLEELFDDE